MSKDQTQATFLRNRSLKGTISVNYNRLGAWAEFTFRRPTTDPARDILLTGLGKETFLSALSMLLFKLGSIATTLGLQILK